MGSLLERLAAREQAARTGVERLRAEMDRLAVQLAAEEELLGRLAITKQTIIEVLSGREPGGEDGDGAAEPAPVAAQVPAFGGDGDGRRLPVAYRDVVEVVADAGRPLRASQVCQALGWAASHGIGKGCGPSSSGWYGGAGWSRSRSSRDGSPARAAWPRPGRSSGRRGHAPASVESVR